MNKLLAVLTLGTIIVLTGCNKSTSGGPGVDSPDSEQAMIGLTDDTFSLDTPTLSTKLAQGETSIVTIGIKRGANLDQNVTLSFNELPTGVAVNPSSPVIMRGETGADITVTAAADAALGDFSIEVMGIPKTGPTAITELKITVGEA